MKKIWISLVLLFLSSIAEAQEIHQIKERLFSAGYENVLIQEEETKLRIFFEHREFRSPYASMRYAKDLISDLTEKNIVWVPEYHNTPIAQYLEPDFESLEINKEDRLFFKQHNRVWKNYRLHLRIQPDLTARFGYFEHPLEVRFNAILDSRIYLARGLSLQTGISFPVENSLDERDMSPHLAPSMLHYFTQILPWNYLAFSVGTYYYDRFGLDLEYRHSPAESPWSYGIEAAYTGYYLIEGSSYYNSSLSDLYVVADVEYRLPLQNLSLKISGGQFLFNDQGLRADLIRQFGSVDLGLYVAATDSGNSAGFQFAFSIFPGAIFRTPHVELRTTEEFRWEYNYNNFDPVAQKFRLGMPRLSDILRQYKQDFIQSRHY